MFEKLQLKQNVLAIKQFEFSNFFQFQFSIFLSFNLIFGLFFEFKKKFLQLKVTQDK